ncbi:hypothetical protein MCERE19_01183 [Spirosomataceae bacterium]
MTLGVGFIVMVKVCVAPVQEIPLFVYVGVTLIVPKITSFVAFMALNASIFPVPLAASPIFVLVLLQLNTVPVTLPVKVIAEVFNPLQII